MQKVKFPNERVGEESGQVPTAGSGGGNRQGRALMTTQEKWAIQSHDNLDCGVECLRLCSAKSSHGTLSNLKPRVPCLCNTYLLPYRQRELTAASGHGCCLGMAPTKSRQGQSAVASQEASSEGVLCCTFSVGAMSLGEACWNTPRLWTWAFLGLPFNPSHSEVSIQVGWKARWFWRGNPL